VYHGRPSVDFANSQFTCKFAPLCLWEFDFLLLFQQKCGQQRQSSMFSANQLAKFAGSKRITQASTGYGGPADRLSD
jgi:hypothetical protein